MDNHKALNRKKLSTPHVLSLFFLSLLHTTSGAEGESLGRLFFTPQQRAFLDRQRQLNASVAPSAMLNENRLTFNGEVRRSSGKNTHWINGEPTPSVVATRPEIPIGDTLLPQTGEKESLLGNGTITVKPAPRSP